MPVVKRNNHIIGNLIKKFLSKPFYGCVLYIQGIENCCPLFQKTFYTFIMKNNSTKYKFPIKEDKVKNLSYYSSYIYYH